MRLRLHDVSSKRLSLELEGEDQRAVSVDDVIAANGLVFQQGSQIHLRPVEAQQFVTSSLDWSFTSGRLSITAPATVEDFHADAAYALGEKRLDVPFLGTIRLGSLRATDATLELAGVRVCFDIQLQRADFHHDESEGGHLRCSQFRVTNIQTTISGYLLRAEELIARSFRCSWGDGNPVTFEANTVLVKGLTIHSDNVDIRIDELELPKGISIRGGSVRAPEVHVVRGDLVVEDVLKLSGGGRTDDETGEYLPLIDWLFLDQLSGRIDVDLTVDATVPVIGKRKATHHFRVAVEDGTINYRELEGDLASLESFVVAISIREDDSQLVLERGLPGWRKPFIGWNLSEVELALAKNRVMRLRTVPKIRLIRTSNAEEERKDDGESSFALRRLDFDNIDIAIQLTPLHASARGGLRGVVPQVSLGRLLANGAIWHRPQSDAIEPSSIEFQAHDLHAEVRDLYIGKLVWNAAMLHFASLHSAALSFHGYEPRRLQTSLSGLRLEAFAIRGRGAG